MADQTNAFAYIRFQLDQLSQRNGQHEFEHLCRHLARARVCGNILPATGPVQGGGDQGRDFETFRTHLAQTAVAGASFVGFSDKPIAFACSLDQDPKSKIERDVKSITSQGSPIDEIHFFSSRDIKIAARHAVKDWARQEFGVHIEVYDAQWISETLYASDVFWIAEQFLNIPSSVISPPAANHPSDWYSQTIKKWREAPGQAQTYADFVEIRAAARVARGPLGLDEYGHPVNRFERPEFPFWIERMDQIAEQGLQAHLRRRALFEASVLRLRGLGTMWGHEDRLRRYFADVPQMAETSELDDANSLLAYCIPAAGMNEVGLERDELKAWQLALKWRLDERLDGALRNDRVSEQCALLEILGMWAFHNSIGETGTSGVGETLAYWDQVADAAERAPLFPLRSFSEKLAQGAEFFGMHPKYQPLADKVDRLLAEREGGFAKAQRCLERAYAFQKAGDLPKAMAELHKAKVNWFAPETLPRALTALRMLGRMYAEQGLFFAAKYYALSAAYIALKADVAKCKPTIASALFSAATYDYQLGAWHGFLELADIGTIIYPNYARDPVADFNDSDGDLQMLLGNMSMFVAAARRVHPPAEQFSVQKCKGIAERVGLSEAFDQTLPTADQTLAGVNEDDLWDLLESEFTVAPWSDSGPVRRAEWQAHGVSWHFEWGNDGVTAPAVEEFLVAFQVLLSDLAGTDLLLTRSSIHARVRLLQDGEAPNPGSFQGYDFVFEASNTESRCEITLPSSRTFRDATLAAEETRAGVLSIAMGLLSEVSLLSGDQLRSVMQQRLAADLLNKLEVGASYRIIWRQFVGVDEFEKSQRVAHGAMQSRREFQTTVNAALPWCDLPGPGYSPEAAEELLQNRYVRASAVVRHTLPRLNQEKAFSDAVQLLRAEGWLDWHILGAVAAIALSYRMNRLSVQLPDMESERRLFQKMAESPESEKDVPVPLSEFSTESLRRQMNMGAVSTLENYGLHIHAATPNFEALIDFLACRYRYWEDDIDHDDLLSIEAV